MSAAAWMVVETCVIRKNQPNRFGPGPIDTLKATYKRYFGGGEQQDDDAVNQLVDEIDPTRERHRRSVFATQERAGLRMWAM